MDVDEIVLLVVGLALMVALLVTVPVILVRGKGAAVRAGLDADLAQEPPVRGPERAVYQGNTGSYPHVAGNGWMALTGRRILFRKSVGVPVDVDLGDVTSVSTSKTFNRSRVGGQLFLVVHTRRGDLGYLVGDTDAWVSALEGRLGSSWRIDRR